MRKLGINLHSVGGLTDEEYIKTIAQAGFKTCFSGLCDIERHVALAETFAKYGVEYETVHSPFGHINDIWLEGERGDAMLGELMHCIDCCKAAGVGITVVHLSAGDNPPSITDIGRKRFAELVEYAAKNGVVIAFENQRLLANIAWAFETFKDPASVGFCWDCGHEACFAHGREYMPLFGDRLVCTHIHDNHQKHNGDEHLLPFRGSIDFNKVASFLRARNYGGSLMLEVFADLSDHFRSFDEKGVADNGRRALAEKFISEAYESVSKLSALLD